MRSPSFIPRILIGSAMLRCVAACPQADDSPGLITLYVTRTLNLHSADGSHARVVAQGKYEVMPSPNPPGSMKDGSSFTIGLKYDGGKMLSGSGEAQGQTFSFLDDSADVGSYSSNLTGPQKDGSILINLRVGPGFAAPKDDPKLQDAAQTVLACFSGWPSPTISYAQLRDLGSLNKVWNLPPFPPELAKACQGTVATIEVRATPYKLEYDKTDLDIANLWYQCGRPLDPHVDKLPGRGSWFLHANFAGKLFVDGENKIQINTDPQPCSGDQHEVVTSTYRILRKSRSWQIAASGRLAATPQWQPDNSHAVQDWVDNPSLPAGLLQVPGTLGAALSPDKWPNTGILDEFLVGVQGAPSCGCVYIAYRLEVKPRAYRIRYSAPLAIDDDRWNQLRNSPAPPDKLAFNGDDGWVYLHWDKTMLEWRIAPGVSH